MTAVNFNTASSSRNSTNNRRNRKFNFACVLSGMLFFTLLYAVWEVLIAGKTGVGAGTGTGVGTATTIGLDAVVNSNLKTAKLRSNAKTDTITDANTKSKSRPTMVAATFDESTWKERNEMNARIRTVTPNACGYTAGLFNLTEDELHPTAATEQEPQRQRHMVTPPEGGKLSLVCCETTKGSLAMVAHHAWAPRGADKFVAMVRGGYFDTTVPMMRCVKDWLCQFGINSDPEVGKKFRPKTKLLDDPNWLPEGPKFRENELGVKRFAQGYLAYAGGGPNSRGNQFIVALQPNGPLAGGSPWEVPWGELVGKESFQTLSKIYTGYGEKGPSQGQLSKRGMDAKMKEDFPDIDYINRCVVVDEKEADELPRVGRKYSEASILEAATENPTSGATSA